MNDFSQLSWLFSSNASSRGIVRLNISEAAMLWRHAAAARTAMLEIGSRHGGSTVLMNRANPGVHLTSIDAAPEHDQRCAEILADWQVEIVRGDSRTFQHSRTYDLAFIDGDHSYAGVKADFENLKRNLSDDAVVLFHDAAPGAYGTCPGVERFTQEMIAAGTLEVIETADSMMACRVKSLPRRKLTIGTLTHSDFHGLYFAFQSIQLHHPEILKDIEFLILDNSPENEHGKAAKDLTNWFKLCPVRYAPITDDTGTALRNRIFKMATTPYVLCMDSHVMFPAGALRKLIEFFDAGKDAGNLLHGPMLYDNMEIGATHMDMVWRDGMWGIWAIDPRGLDENADPFEIPAHGMGMFACRKDSWLWFHPGFTEFGGEECYIHEKFRKAGRKTICLPFLRWLHRFPRPDGVAYPNSWEARIMNYALGINELYGFDHPTMHNMVEHFSTLLPEVGVCHITASSIGLSPSKEM